MEKRGRKEYGKKYRQDHKEEIREYQKKYRQEHREEMKEQDKKYYQEHREEMKEQTKKYQQANKKEIKEQRKKYQQEHRKERNEHARKRRQADIHFRIKGNISTLIGSRLKRRLSSKNKKSTFTFLPYTVDELRKHLESQFEPWMDWNNYGSGRGKWNIDHIKPDSLFNYKSVDDKEFQRCWVLDNLRPMDAIENIKKSNKY